MKTLILERVSKKYDNLFALTDISLEISVGMFGLLGPNGAGKTTLMRILTTLIQPTSGNIWFNDVRWSDSEIVRSLIGYLPQKFSLYKNLTVFEALDHIAILKGINNKKRRYLVQEVIEKVNLVDYVNKKIDTLSGGMIRRIGIAQAILGEPPIIIVDEPTTGLDPEERMKFRKLLQSLAQESIVIISTHIVEDIEATCDNATILYKGCLLATGDIISLANNAKGKIWELVVPSSEYKFIPNNYNVISCKRIDNIYLIRVMSESQPLGGKPVPPSLEDGYLYLMGCSKYER